jgi:hypothetical protein
MALVVSFHLDGYQPSMCGCFRLGWSVSWDQQALTHTQGIRSTQVVCLDQRPDIYPIGRGDRA